MRLRQRLNVKQPKKQKESGSQKKRLLLLKSRAPIQVIAQFNLRMAAIRQNMTLWPTGVRNILVQTQKLLRLMVKTFSKRAI
jgi:hypothetical protein